MLQVDVIGDQINGYAWRPSAPKPTTPLLSAVDNQLASGLPGVYYSPDPEIEGAAVFRYVQVADRPIVPEPSGGALCAIGGTLLSLGLLFQRRRYRP